MARETEEDVKTRYITPALEISGWKRNQLSMEYKLTDGRIVFEGNQVKRKNRKRCDYLLRIHEGFPIAVLEAKDGNHHIADGLSQAMNYAKILNLNFAYSSNGKGFVEYDFSTGRQRELAINEFPTQEELIARYKNIHNLTSQESQKALESTLDLLSTNTPRYYQNIAIRLTIEAISRGQKRILLVMATGTGKTQTAYQITHRFRQMYSKTSPRILYLADRNVLTEQTLKGDFLPLKNISTIVEKRQFENAYQIYFALYHQFIDGENKYYDQLPRDFFDLIFIDECHRGSAKDDSTWREILEYFDSSIQIGLTATPKNDTEGSNLAYFGKPIYTYSLKQGIDDGFLAPYKVVRYGLDIDLTGYRPEECKIDLNGNIVPDRHYEAREFNRVISISERTQAVAKQISNFLKYTLKDPYAKTIVFCKDSEHALEMQSALINENQEEMIKNSNYVVRITSNDENGLKQLDNFMSKKSVYPVIATTARLLSTGVDTKMVKVIALDREVNSMTEFKQIVGRGTRLEEELGKKYFTILDFCGATKKFADPDFDGNTTIIEQPKKPTILPDDSFPPQKPEIPDEKQKKYRIDGVEVNIVTELHQILDENGKLISNDFIAYSRNQLTQKCQTLKDFLKLWNSEPMKTTLLENLQNQGILIEEIKAMDKYKNLDEFDILISLAYDQPTLSRKERAQKASKILEKYEGKAREILQTLLDKYSNFGIQEIENPNVLTLAPLNYLDSSQAVSEFGGIDNYIQALNSLKSEIYQTF